MNIEWKITEQTVAQKLTSSDNRWHISRKQTGKEPSKFFLANCDLLLSPHGTGKDYKECFESMKLRRLEAACFRQRGGA